MVALVIGWGDGEVGGGPESDGGVAGRIKYCRGRDREGIVMETVGVEEDGALGRDVKSIDHVRWHLEC